MKNFILILLLAFSYFDSFSQKVSIQKWVNHTVDSLKKEHVDAIEYYHQYCGECEVKKLGTQEKYCQTDNSFEQIENIIIYQQKGKYYSLTFNCNYPSIKKELTQAKSLSYFVSIIGDLNKRDKIEKARLKRTFFPPPIVSDGVYNEAFIYYENLKQNAFKHDDTATENSKPDFWNAKEAKLLSLITADISPKNQNPPSF